MAQRTILPRICIALGFPDPETLASHAHQEYNAGERFFEFRLDYLATPEHGASTIRKFLARHSDCTILATCRRRDSVYFAILDQEWPEVKRNLEAKLGRV